MALLAFVVSAVPEPACESMCVGPVLSLGLDRDERAAAEVALARALNTSACIPVASVDDVCFDDDGCLQASLGLTKPGFVAVRAVRAGAQLRISWARVTAEAVQRGEHVEPVLAFLVSGTLDPAIASCSGARPLPLPLPLPLTASAPPAPAPPATALTSSAPDLALVGGIVGAAATASLVGSLAILGAAEAPGGVKEAAVVVGWLSCVGVLVGGTVAVVGLVGQVGDDGGSSP